MSWPHLRKYPRAQVNFSVQCMVGSDPFRGRVLTLGGGGLYIEMRRSLPPGSSLKLRFRPAKHLPVISVEARTRWERPGEGVGVEFTEIDSDDRQRILRVILRRLTEQRQFPRKPLVIQVEHAAGSFLGVSRDISVGGMFISTEQGLPLDTQARLRFNLEDGGSVLEVTVDVVYNIEKLGIGTRFLDLTPADRTRIDIYVTRGAAS
ncbi:MAG: PilZ domain-containing protein [Acidobacteriia bacterium]|nr:PilZ domain-containing protein [Terriglobia bacterium]